MYSYCPFGHRSHSLYLSLPLGIGWSWRSNRSHPFSARQLVLLTFVFDATLLVLQFQALRQRLLACVAPEAET
jgi:hypothetical protein